MRNNNDNNELALRFSRVSKTYQGEIPVHAVQDVSLTLQTGAFAALVGPSGSGKSTLLNLASGLERPTVGKIEIGNQVISSMSQHELGLFRRENLGFVFQSYNLFPSLNAIENVEFVLAIRGESGARSRQAARVALEKVGLAEKANRFPNELSGGQQQRVAVARAIAAEPRIVFADEPTANLDSESAFNLIALFSKLNQEDGVTFLFSTHDHRLVDRVSLKIEIKDGKIGTQ